MGCGHCLVSCRKSAPCDATTKSLVNSRNSCIVSGDGLLDGVRLVEDSGLPATTAVLESPPRGDGGTS
jgi:hypothetical protein